MVPPGLWLSNSLPWASLSLPPMRGSKVIPRTGFHFIVQKRPVPESSGASLTRRPHQESRIEAYPGGRKSTCGSISASSADDRKKESHETVIPMCYSPQPHHHLLLLLFRLVCFSIFLISGGALLPTGLCLKKRYYSYIAPLDQMVSVALYNLTPGRGLTQPWCEPSP